METAIEPSSYPRLPVLAIMAGLLLAGCANVPQLGPSPEMKTPAALSYTA